MKFSQKKWISGIIDMLKIIGSASIVNYCVITDLISSRCLDNII